MSGENVCTGAGCDAPQIETLCNIAQGTLGRLWDAIAILDEIHGFGEKESEVAACPDGTINILEQKMQAARYCANRIVSDLKILTARIGLDNK